MVCVIHNVFLINDITTMIDKLERKRLIIALQFLWNRSWFFIFVLPMSNSVSDARIKIHLWNRVKKIATISTKMSLHEFNENKSFFKKLIAIEDTPYILQVLQLSVKMAWTSPVTSVNQKLFSVRLIKTRARTCLTNSIHTARD